MTARILHRSKKDREVYLRDGAEGGKTIKPGKVAADVDEYLARLKEPARNALTRLREQIKQAAPNAKEVISHQIPTYLLNGPLVHFAAQPKHLSFTVVSLDVLDSVRDELAGFEVSGRTVHFSAEKALPAATVKRIVKARVRENEAHGTGRYGE